MRKASTSHARSGTPAHVLQRAAPVEIIEEQDVMPDTAFEQGARGTLDPDLRHRMISEAAYHLYAQSGYADGYDLDDWLQAETQVDHMAISPSGDTVAEAEAAETAET